MSKSVLGRGLSSLMGDQKPVGQDNPMAAPAADEAATPGVGSLFKGVRKEEEKNIFAAPTEALPAAPEIRTEPEPVSTPSPAPAPTSVLAATPAPVSAPAPVAEKVSPAQPFRSPAPAESKLAAASTKKSGLPYWYYFAGDVLLVTLVLLVVGRGGHPLSLGETIFCIVTMLLAAALGVAGIIARHNSQD